MKAIHTSGSDKGVTFETIEVYDGDVLVATVKKIGDGPASAVVAGSEIPTLNKPGKDEPRALEDTDISSAIGDISTVHVKPAKSTR